MESTALPIEGTKAPDHLAGRVMLDRLMQWSSHHALQITFAFYSFVGLAFVIFGNTNRDEGWYLYASRLVYEGKIPYRDFPYFQMPLLPYIYGLPQLLFGPSLLVGRLTSFALSLITVGVGMRLARRLGGRMAAVLFVAIAVVNVHAMWTFTTTRTEPLVAPLAMLSLFFLIKPRRSTFDLVFAPSLMLWATAVRLTAAPAFIAVLALCLYQARRNRNQWDMILALVGLQVVLFVVIPFALAPERMVFSVWTSQELRGNQAFFAVHPLGVQLRDKALFLPQLMSWYPLAVVLTVGVAGFLLIRLRRGWRPSVAALGEWPTAHLVMLSLVALLFLPHLALNEIQEFYFIPAFPIAALLATSAVQRLSGAWSRGAETLLLPSLLASLVLVEAFAFANDFPQYINTTNPDLRGLQDVGAYLKSVVPPDKRILAFDTSVVFEADRRVNEGLEMELFSYWPRLSASRAHRYGVVNYQLLQRMGEDDDTGAIVMSTWDEMRLMATGSQGGYDAQEIGQAEFAAITLENGRFYLARVYPGLGGIHDSLWVYLRAE